MPVWGRPVPARRWPVPGNVHRTGLPVERLADEALLAGLGTGDPEMALAFVRRFQRRVFGVTVTVLGDPALAEDVVQQTFERAWRHAPMYAARRGSVRTLLVTLAHNLAIDTIRVRRPLPLEPGDLLALSLTAARDQNNGAWTAGVRAAIATLPPTQARALVIAGVHGVTPVACERGEATASGR